MIEINEAFVDSVAPNANALKNGRAVSRKFLCFCKSSDETLIFGECKGSGKGTYHTSVDFIIPETPVYRCSCPSRQFPCKHALGLMYSYVKGQTFENREIPEDVRQKREKIQKKAEKKKTKKPRKVNTSALKKKILTQLEGLNLLKTLTHDLIRAGLGSISPKTASKLEKQSKQMADAYLPGAQMALRRLADLFLNKIEGEDNYSEALSQLIFLHSLCVRGQKYLQNRIENPNSALGDDLDIAALLGHAWQLAELKKMGNYRQNVSLIQLSFNAYNDSAGRRFVETGIWINLETGQIQLTQNFRPYRAAAHIKETDAFFNVVKAKELFIYPGRINPRIRWEAMIQRPLKPSDCKSIQAFGKEHFDEVIYEVKNHLKHPLSDKSLFIFLKYNHIGYIDKQMLMEDAHGTRLILADNHKYPEPATCALLKLLPKDYFENQAVLGRFFCDNNRLCVKPLSIVTKTDIFRLAF